MTIAMILMGMMTAGVMKGSPGHGHYAEFFPSLAFLLSLAGCCILQTSRLLFREAALQRAPSRWGGHAVGLPTVDLDAMASHLKQGHYHCGLKKGHYSLCGTNLAGESLGMVWADTRGQS